MVLLHACDPGAVEAVERSMAEAEAAVKRVHSDVSKIKKDSKVRTN